MFVRTGIIGKESKTSPACGRPRWAGGKALLRLVFIVLFTLPAFASGVDARKLKSGAPPEYPEIAARMNIRGIAKVRVTIAPDGSVKEVRELGGNPVLVDALMRAVKKWKYEPAEKTSVIEVKFAFGTE